MTPTSRTPSLGFEAGAARRCRCRGSPRCCACACRVRWTRPYTTAERSGAPISEWVRRVLDDAANRSSSPAGPTAVSVAIVWRAQFIAGTPGRGDDPSRARWCARLGPHVRCACCGRAGRGVTTRGSSSCPRLPVHAAVAGPHVTISDRRLSALISPRGVQYPVRLGPR